MQVIELTKENFEEMVLKSEIPVFVDFWASWCSPCRRFAPIVEELAKDIKEEARICKLNVDDEKELASAFNIMTIPTGMIFKEGKVVSSFVGIRSIEELKAMLLKK